MSEAAEKLSTESARRFLTFKMDSRLFALAAEDVVEVIRTPSVARVPQAPKALIGLSNLRGTVLPIAGLRELLGADSSDGKTSRAIVLAGSHLSALAVDTVEAIVTVNANKIELSRAGLTAHAGERVAGAFEVEGAGTAKILDVRAMLDDVFADRVKHRRDATLRPPQEVKAEQKSIEREALVTFDLSGQEYALSLSVVDEIVVLPESSTPVPGSEKLVIGVMAHRGRLLPLFSLRGLLGLERTQTPHQKVVVASIAGATVGLVADRAHAIISAERDLIDAIPPMLASRSAGETKIKAIYRGEEGRRLISILSTEQLFREDVMQRLGSMCQQVEEDARSEASDTRQFLVFRLGDDEFGLPIEAVDEVARLPGQITRVPKTPKFLEGVVNLRGDVLPVIDQRRRFDMPPLENNDGKRLIVVRTERHRAGLIVDSVKEVLRCSSQAISPPPELTGDITRLVHGVINRNDEERVLLLLDPNEILTRAERGLLDTFVPKVKAPS